MIMGYSVAASHAKGKCATDKIFGANGAAVKAALEVGKSCVTNATIGAILDDEEKLSCLPTVEQVYRSLSMNDIIAYAPIAGLPSFLNAAIDLNFADHRPDGYVEAVATSGGSGGIHHTIWNYSELGDTVLTSDWFWGPYRVLCQDMLRKLDTYTLFDEQLNFNLSAFEKKVESLLAVQKSLVVIINSPAHNPTGYSLTDSEWSAVLDVAKRLTKDSNKRLTFLVDVAYIDYAGERNAARSFMSLFSNLPKNILTVFTTSMSKGYTMYGQRVGAMIGLSADKDVIQEFVDINQYTSRATWSNINRGVQQLLATIYEDKSLLAKVDSERALLYQMIRERADLFMNEAKEAKLHMLPYIAGFFLTIPAKNPDAVCAELAKDYIFAVPLSKGIRVAVCAVPKAKMVGFATKMAQAIRITE
jgi:aromatic-amino-acid transaminase